jgi:serine phosphatase RsbU (regulator of sigma subunit)
MERLCDVVLAHGNGPLTELQNMILSAVQKFAEGAEQADDMTLLLMRYTG